MKVRFFKSVAKAIEYAGEKPVKIEHFLKAEDNVPKHKHPSANEWLIADNGEFIIFCGGDFEILKPSKKKVALIMFPLNAPHAFLAMKDTKYTVFRDKKDKTEYLADGHVIHIEEN